MVPDRLNHPSRVSGFSLLEFSLLFGVLTLVLVGMVGLMGSSDDGPYPDVPPYRWANALYAKSLLEKSRVTILAYEDQTGGLPGDSPSGNGNGKIEKDLGEDTKVFTDLYRSGVSPQEVVLIRGRRLELYYSVLRAQERILGEGHFFKLASFNKYEALALDRKFDNSLSDSGNIIYSHNDDGTVDLYVKLLLY